MALVTWKDQVLLVRRAVNPGRGLWALPGGYMDAGEMPPDAAQREVREETGVDVQVNALVDVFPLAAADGRVTGIVIALAASLLAGTPAGATADAIAGVTAGDDVQEARWWPAHALPTDLAFESTPRLLAQWVQSRQDGHTSVVAAEFDKEESR